MRYEYAGTIAKVIDGDTLDVVLDLGLNVAVATRIRLRGINAPEVRTDMGKEAKAAVQRMLPEGTQIVVRTHKDKTEKYGRWLGDVWLWPADGESLNQLLVRTGLAQPYDGGPR